MEKPDAPSEDGAEGRPASPLLCSAARSQGALAQPFPAGLEGHDRGAERCHLPPVCLSLLQENRGWYMEGR